MSSDAQKPGPVLVTGSNSGFGLAATLLLAQRGWDVWGTVRTEAKASALSDEAARAGCEERVHATLLDVSDHDSVTAAWGRGEMPEFYAVVNNAGYMPVAAVEEMSAAEAKALLDINLVTPAVIAACAIPAMRRRGTGRIVMVSSVAGREALLPFHAWYHASKFGLEGLTDVLRMEVAPFGIKVSIIQPGVFSTNIQATALSSGSRRPDSPYDQAYSRMRRLTALVDGVAPGPKPVAKAIATAVESGRPKRRYLVGRESLAIRAAGFIPDEVTDRLASFAVDLGSAGRPSTGD